MDDAIKDHPPVEQEPKRKVDLEKELALWDELVSDLENPERHKAYVGHVFRSGLLKEGSRRYLPLIEDKDAYSVEARRLARHYQRQIVNVMFMVPSQTASAKKNPTLGYIATFIAVMVLITGLLVPKYWFLIFVGIAFLVGYFVVKARQFKEISERDQANRNPEGGL
jgi:hypothetical protein